MTRYVLALDQGTTSSRAFVFDGEARPVAVAQREFDQLFPSPGHVEHRPEDIWESQIATARHAIADAGIEAAHIAGIGITNQRETTLLWDKNTGEPIANAIVWQSRISTPICERLKSQGLEELFRDRTGLVLDAYFSGTKIAWMLENVDGVRERAERGDILFGTVDTFLAWRLSGGKVHATDVSNASRTLLFNLHTLDWDDELLAALNVPRCMMPDVHPTSGVVGMTDPAIFGEPIPLAALVGDQQSAMFGQCCFDAGEVKNTYGTGCFLLMNTGETTVPSRNGLLSTVGWQLKAGAPATYCLEGSVFVAGAAIQWLRDGLGLIESSEESESLAARVVDSGGVFFVPAFVGLGAPHWDAQASGMMIGLDRGTTAAHITRAALESLAFQTRDVIAAMEHDAGRELTRLRVDGGASRNDLLMQFQADQLQCEVVRPANPETTAAGAAFLAGLAVDLWSQDELQRLWNTGNEFRPAMPKADADRQYARWQDAVARSQRWRES